MSCSHMYVDPVRGKPRLFERKPRRRGEEKTIINATSGNLTHKAKGVVAEATRLFNRRFKRADHQALSRSQQQMRPCLEATSPENLRASACSTA